MSNALDFFSIAEYLILKDHMRSTECGIELSRDMQKLSHTADLETLKSIARLLLSRDPPIWLTAAVSNGSLSHELIPSQDKDVLSWLEEDLEAILVSAHSFAHQSASDGLRKSLGDAGELSIMSALRASGAKARHVSLISDHFGYDIELRNGQKSEGIEVKAAVATTAGRFFLSRNEYDVAKRMGKAWRLIQVTFSAHVIVKRMVTASDIVEISQLSSETLSFLAPPETMHFRWQESAEFSPDQSLWQPSNLKVPSNFRFDLSSN